MANKVLLKKSSVAAKIPLTSDLDYGELALNYADGKLYFKDSSNNIKNFGSTSYSRIISNTTAISGKGYIADTSAGSFTVTLPSSPATGDSIIIADGANFLANSLTVDRNGRTIEGLADNLTINISGVSVTLTYDGATWQVYTQVGAQGGTEVTLGGIQTLTNKTISGSSNTLTNIPNSALTNSSLTLNGTSVSLGASATITADASTLTGTTLKSTVVSSSLTSVGTLTSLTTSGTIISTVTAGNSFVDVSSTAVSYANNATVNFPSFSGMIMINRQDGLSGNVALWLCGGGVATKLGDSQNNASGTISSSGGINGYVWTNNTGGTVTVTFAAIKGRGGA